MSKVTIEEKRAEAIRRLEQNEDAKQMITSIIEVGSISQAAKLAITMIKSIPGISLAGSVINAIVAESITAVLGESSIYIFERIFLKEWTIKDNKKAQKFVDQVFSDSFASKVEEVVKKVNSKDQSKKIDGMEIAKLVSEVFLNDTKQKSKKNKKK